MHSEIVLTFLRAWAWFGFALGCCGIAMLLVLLAEQARIGRDIDENGGGK